MAVLCLNAGIGATRDFTFLVQKLWRTKVLCGKTRKNRNKFTAEDAEGKRSRGKVLAFSSQCAVLGSQNKKGAIAAPDSI